MGLKWGFQVKSHERRQEWFKLQLDPMAYVNEDTIDFARQYPNMLADPPHYSRSATKLCTDYLTELRKQVIKSLESKVTAAALRTFRMVHGRVFTWVTFHLLTCRLGLGHNRSCNLVR